MIEKKIRFYNTVRKIPVIRKIRLNNLLVISPTFRCNYQCSYCLTPTHLQKIKKEYDYKKILDGLSWYKGHIGITGGEPSIYKGFTSFLNGLKNDGVIGIDTNLSFDTTNFIDEIKINKSRIDICATFHPEFADLKTFERKVKELYNSGFRTWVHLIMHPNHINLISEMQEIFGDTFHPIPCIMNGKIYNFENNKVIVSNYENTTNSNKKRKCFGGYKYFHVQPNGDVYCCATLMCINKGLIGNIFDNFKPNKKLTSCSYNCTVPCDIDYNKNMNLNRFANKMITILRKQK